MLRRVFFFFFFFFALASTQSDIHKESVGDWLNRGLAFQRGPFGQVEQQRISTIERKNAALWTVPQMVC